MYLEAIHAARSGHPGGSATVYPILRWLFFERMQPQPYDFSGDICILSKGHAAPALYQIFQELGIISEEEELKLRKLGSKTQGHPARRWLPEVIASTGSLGQGLAVAAGMALAKRNRNVYCVVGDGDMQEGISTEVARLVVAYGLENLIVVWDKNDKLSDEYSLVFPNIHLEWSCIGWSVFVGMKHEINKGIPTLLVIETDKALPHGSVTMSDKDLEQWLKM